jgi:hypothetical protein
MARSIFTGALLTLALWPREGRAQESRWLTFLSLRPMLGAAVVAPEQGAASGEFAADVTAGLRVFRQRRDGRAWLLGPEVGFSPVTRGGDVTVLWHAGLAVGYGTVPLHVAWTPRFVVGAVGDREALGFRSGVMLTALAGLACVELSYQNLWSGAAREQDVRLTVGVDAGMIAHVLVRSISNLSRW